MRIAIIGAGLIGVSTAWYLRHGGHDVLVLERRAGPGLETSFANGGMLTPSQADPWNAPGVTGKLLRWLGREDAPLLLRPRALPELFGWGIGFLRNSSRARFRRSLHANVRLARFSLDTLRRLRRDTGIEYTGAGVGTLKFYRDQRSLAQSGWLTQELRGAGVHCEPLDGAGVIAHEPALAGIAQHIAGGVRFPDDESGDAHLYCARLAQLAAAAGVEFRYGVDIRRLRCAGGSVAALETTAGEVVADRYVLAAGSYSVPLARDAGLRLPLRPVKGYSLTLDLSGWKAPPRLPLVDDDLHMAVTPLGNRLRVAGTAEFTGFDLDLNPARIAPMRAFVAELFPAQAPMIAAADAQPWAGLRPYTVDGVPIIGPAPLPNLYLNTGHGHLGWSMATGSGRLLAELIEGRSGAINAADYSLKRFGG